MVVPFTFLSHPMDASSHKKLIRTEMLAQRAALAHEQHVARSRALNALLLPALLKQFEQNVSHVTIALYHPFKGEPDVLATAEELASAKHAMRHAPFRELKLALPVVSAKGKTLRFQRWQPGEPLTPNRFGIPEPGHNTPALTPDIILLPCVAFDRRGFRIGYGGGYYDETLRNLRKNMPVTAIGISFAFQETPEIPAESFDEKLDMVVTEREAIRVDG